MDYEPALEDSSYIKLQASYDLFIGGKFQKPSKEQYFPTYNPADETLLSYIALAEPEDVNKAVQAARIGFEKYWSKMTGNDRAKYIFRIARLIQQKAKTLSVLEVLDNGKPIQEAKNFDTPLSAAHFFYYAGWADKLKYAYPNLKARPLGVIGQIVPWNFPLLMAAWKIAPALATGNTVVLKPAPTTSLTALYLAQVIQEADLPPGTVNIITGAQKTGQALVEHSNIDKIAFTGSTAVGIEIQKKIASSSKSLTLELGGKAAHIIFDDAPLDQAIESIINGIYFNQGQVCCAGSRLLVEENIYKSLIAKLKNRMSYLRVGNPLDKNTDVGAIHSAKQLKIIENYLTSGLKDGATLYQSTCNLPAKGYWIAPSLFLDTNQSQGINQEEIFGPVLTVQTFRTPQEAITKANNTPYGLSNGVWTSKGSKALVMSKALKAGVIWLNTYNKFSPASPFGGYKASGFGREGGRQGLLPYLKQVPID